MTDPSLPVTPAPSPLSWILGPTYVLTLGFAGAVVAALSGPIAGTWTVNAAPMFLLAGAVTLLGMLPTLLFGRQRADPALVVGSTLVGMALFSRLAVEQGDTLSLLLPALGGSFGLAPVLMAEDRQQALAIAWLVAEIVLYGVAQALLAVGS